MENFEIFLISSAVFAKLKMIDITKRIKKIKLFARLTLDSSFTKFLTKLRINYWANKLTN